MNKKIFKKMIIGFLAVAVVIGAAAFGLSNINTDGSRSINTPNFRLSGSGQPPSGSSSGGNNQGGIRIDLSR